MEEVRKLKANVNASASDVEEMQNELAVIDFKMVTFSLAGKDYAIDIMRVKEIQKAGNFTYVPNTSPFVLGVYNLRGDIIPIIDLRIFFNIPTPTRKKNQKESMVVITVDDQTFGVVVDNIDKVVGVASSNIQPPHPIFGDINIKYIHGVVESDGRLYILLDVEKIFASRKKNIEEKEELVAGPVLTETVQTTMQQSGDSLDIKFISDTLAAMGKFYTSSVNEDWMQQRFLEWKDLRIGGNLQIDSDKDADEFLGSFISPFNRAFWSEAYINSYYKLLPENESSIINAWVVGCAQGHEAYSLAVLLKLKYPRARIRLYANDADLLAISSAPMLAATPELQAGVYEQYITKTANGNLTFNKDIKDMILFEYHDCTHQNVVPDMDIILSRDVLSFMKPDAQRALIEEFRDKLKDSGVVILGQHETMPKKDGWLRTVDNNMVIFSKE